MVCEISVCYEVMPQHPDVKVHDHDTCISKAPGDVSSVAGSGARCERRRVGVWMLVLREEGEEEEGLS